MSRIKGLVIGAVQSGAGKTTISCALASALWQKGLQIAPFKVGPDYIDASHLSRAVQSPCYNLDLWMTGPKGVKASFARGVRHKDFALVEGVMGLFDGAVSGEGSTASVAKVLGLPVLLVLNARGISQTLAAVARGLMNFDQELSFLGVVVTEIASLKQEKLLLLALERAGIRCFGFFPRKEEISLPKRHLGLFLAEETAPEWYDRLATLAQEHLDLETLVALCPEIKRPSFSPLPFSVKTRIAVARDRAFCFYYQENLDLLREAGAEIVYFSPLKDPLPEASAYYFGGGYPELFAAELAERKDLFRTLKDRFEKGALIFAECGGFIFLNRKLTIEDKSYSFCGLLPGEVHLSGRLQALGYRKVLLKAPNFFGKNTLKGHEFRYSTLKNGNSLGFEAFDAFGKKVATFGIVAKNLFASYLHLHFGSNPQAARNFVFQAAESGN